MALALVLLLVAVTVLSAWVARLDYLLHQVLERERAGLEAEAERLRRSRL